MIRCPFLRRCSEIDDLHFVERRAQAEILHYLDDSEYKGVLLFGEPGTGKTTLLRMLEDQLRQRGRAAFYISLAGLVSPAELGSIIVDAVTASSFADIGDVTRTLRSSSDPPLKEAADILRRASARISSPVLLFDALDESPYGPRLASAIEEFSLRLDDWKLVVSSRAPEMASTSRFSPLRGFRPVKLGNFTRDEVTELLRKYSSELSANDIDVIARQDPNPLAFQISVRSLQRPASSDLVRRVAGGNLAPRLLGDLVLARTSLKSIIEQQVDQALNSSADPVKLDEMFEDIALAGGSERITTLAYKVRVTEQEVRDLLSTSDVLPLLLFGDLTGTSALFHHLVSEIILARRILASPFRLIDLRFGAEEAERDYLLDESFVQPLGMRAIVDQRRSIVIGDRGSGKSAIFHKLASGAFAPDDGRPIEVCAVTDTGDLLHRVVDGDAWLDADALLAAWRVVVASVVASAVPASAPARLRRNAADLRSAFGVDAEPASLARRVGRVTSRLLGGTTLNFAVGPVNLQAKLPSGVGVRPGRASMDVGSFLKDADNFLHQSGRHVMVMFDRIDETFKYDRVKQEALVQALLQAEARVSLLDCIVVS